MKQRLWTQRPSSSTSTLLLLLLSSSMLLRSSSGQSVDFCSTGGKSGQCKPLVKCVRFSHEIPELQSHPCQLRTGETGVCCPHIVRGAATSAAWSQYQPTAAAAPAAAAASTSWPPRRSAAYGYSPYYSSYPPYSRRYHKYSYYYNQYRLKGAMASRPAVAARPAAAVRTAVAVRPTAAFRPVTAVRPAVVTAPAAAARPAASLRHFGPSRNYQRYNTEVRKRSATVLQRPAAPKVPLPPIRTTDIQEAVDRGAKRRLRRRRIEDALTAAGLVISSESAAAKHRRLQNTNARARQLGTKALGLEDTSLELSQRFSLSPAQGTHALPVFSLVGTSLAVSDDDDACNEVEVTPGRRQGRRCDPNARFRTQDGECNNLGNSNWGRANVALQRVLSPEYQDGISTPRGGQSEFSAGTLPSPRTVSAALIPDVNIPSRDWTLLLMQWGQFLDHDITHTPLVEAQDESDISCCSSGRPTSGRFRHPECFPVQISLSDPFYGPLGQTCMEFVRSMPARNPACSLGPREQVNQITAFIDASNVYGSDVAEARALRLGRNGRLRVTKFRDEDLLPLDPEECADDSNRRFCFAAGDARCNEQPQLAVMHTLWMREHNRIASQLALLNSHWDDERIYQETRKIVGAEMQHITYNEWLPIILGMSYMDENDLSPERSGFTNKYDPSIDPTVVNAFATAAFRFGHSLVQGHIDWLSVFGNRVKSLRLHRHQQEPFELYEEDAVDGLVRGLATQPAQMMDTSFSKELTERLFQAANVSTHGMDLVSLNIQRGRDHGIPSYNNYRRLCGLQPLAGWRDLTLIVTSPELVPRLQLLYSSWEDIDLFLGGVIERPVQGSLLGPTFRCLVGDQFKRLKFGDRFWFEEGGQPNSFTQNQVDAIRESNMARIICDNGDNIQLMQPLAFRIPTGTNEKTGCSSSTAIPRVRLEAWREF